MSQMIYHVPYALDTGAKTGSGIRPVRMLEAFRSLGYQVELVAGHSKERARIIKALRARIKSGEKFAFVYSESSTMPTPLTDPRHIPVRPLMDFRFLRLCRVRGIRTGLFYRDIYWRFPQYNEQVNVLLGLGTRFFYNLDLLGYKRSIDKLYLPSLGMGKFVPHMPSERFAALPPGGQIVDLPTKEKSEFLELFYVGGLGGYYDMRACVRAVNASSSAHLTICTTKQEWEAYKEDYSEILTDKISIVHKSGAELVEHYAKADACMLFIEPSVYRSFAAPIKFAEYLGFGKPVIVNDGTNVAEFVRNHGNGWVLPFETSVLTDLIETLTRDPEQLREATKTTLAVREQNTWEARARQVERDLAGS
ncbi:hypothetical protein FHU41_001106 [Psychromicrobium silvestre]|uniref:Glycosyl transferases group 1 n=1 Tax=Psychromicrobium silvestre TaxID=1645614 RepID=A0A7Y9LSP0_9MICC|nr:glycosyltransferase [Psychromicrobium silvestre]NYE94885.1 hypothetical protein [Psychromicrobium silvestre]